MKNKMKNKRLLKAIILIIGVTAIMFHAECIKLGETNVWDHPNIKKILSEEQQIKALPFGSTTWAIYGVESTFGKNDYCKTKGKFNGYGYGVPDCYNSLMEVSASVSAWLVRQIKVKGLNFYEAMCYYNIGKVMEDCDYAHKVLWFDTVNHIAI